MVPFVDDPDFRLYLGDVREVLQSLPAESVHCPCGCGETFSPIGSRGRPRRYFSPACSLRVNHNTAPTFAGRSHSPESRAVMSEKARGPRPHLRGAKNGMHGRGGAMNPRYVDGSSPERQRAYASAAWKAVARAVRERDGFRCVKCGAEKQGRSSLHLHHVKPWAGNPESRFDPDNILTLCAACHRAEHARGGGALYGAVHS